MIAIELKRTIITPVNRHYTVAGNRIILSNEWRASMAIAKQMISAQYGGPVMTSDLAIKIESGKKRRDIDAEIKFILDALQGIIYENDRQVLLLTVDQRKKSDKNTDTVTISEIGEKIK